MTQDEENLEDRLERIERYADQDHETLKGIRGTDLKKLAQDLEALKKDVESFKQSTNKAMKRLMWLIDALRCTGLENHPEAKAGLDKRFRDQFEELKKLLGQ